MSHNRTQPEEIDHILLTMASDKTYADQSNQAEVQSVRNMRETECVAAGHSYGVSHLQSVDHY